MVTHQQEMKVVPLVSQLEVEVALLSLDNGNSTDSCLDDLVVMDDEPLAKLTVVNKVELSDCDLLSLLQCPLSFVDSLQ